MNNFKKTKLAVAAAAAIGLSLPASAIVVVGGENGWEVSFDGNINQFYVWTDPDARPDNVIGGNMNLTGERSSRFRTGLMPALFSFNVKAPTWNGLEMGARISFAGQTNNANTQNNNTVLGTSRLGTGITNSSDTTNFGGNLEFREAYFTVDGAFGQILLGRTLDLFMGKNILTDQTLFGVGGTGTVHGGGFTLGRIGYGYLYPNFNAQLRWTSPDMMGFKLSLAAVDPSQVCGEGRVGNLIGASGLNCAKTTNTPRGEGQISYANTFTNGSYQVWGAGMWQNAKQQPLNIASNPSNNDINVWGWTVGAQVKVVGFDFNGSYYDGRGLGTSFLLDADSLDATGQKRKNKGWMAQGGYTIMGHTKIAVSYGRSQASETANDSLCRMGSADCVGGGAGFRRLKNQQAYVAGIYHDVNANLKLVAEYSRIINEWYGHGARQTANVVGVGGYFFW
jgi:hypothetical protein